MLPLSVGPSRNQIGTGCAICTGNFIFKERKDKTALFEHLTSISKKTWALYVWHQSSYDDYTLPHFSLLLADQKRSPNKVSELRRPCACVWAGNPTLIPRVEPGWAAAGTSRVWVAQMAISGGVMEHFRLSGARGTNISECGAGTKISGAANLQER